VAFTTATIDKVAKFKSQNKIVFPPLTQSEPEPQAQFKTDINNMANHRADEKRFLDERGSGGPLAPNGLNPATIMEKPVRERIIDCYFWKDQCFGVNEADIVNRVVEHVYFIAGTYGDSQRPSPFLCLAFKLLQLAPSKEIIQEYLGYGGEKFKYLRALAVFYVRLTFKAKDVYLMLEEFLEDKRKLKRKTRFGGNTLTYMDQLVDDLLVKDRMCSTTLWKLPKRAILEDQDELDPRISPLGDIEDLLESDPEEVDGDRERRDSGSESSSGSEFGEVKPEAERDRSHADKDTNGMDTS
jgi:pre-mRNA-splicing factor 38A